MTPWTIAHQAPLSMGFSRQEYWNRLVTIFFSRGPSWPKDQIHNSCIGRWILYHWATWETPRKWKWTLLSHVRLFATPWIVHGILQARILEWVAFPFLQGIFPTQGSNPGLPHCRWLLYQLSHKGSPRILRWVAYPFSRGSSRPRNGTGVSCFAGGFFINSAIRKPFVSWLNT